MTVNPARQIGLGAAQGPCSPRARIVRDLVFLDDQLEISKGRTRGVDWLEGSLPIFFGVLHVLERWP